MPTQRADKRRATTLHSKRREEANVRGFFRRSRTVDKGLCGVRARGGDGEVEVKVKESGCEGRVMSGGGGEENTDKGWESR